MTAADAEQVVQAMKRLAVLRQAELSAPAYAAYVQALHEDAVPGDVVVEACRRLERTARAEGETAFPELGRILAVCHEVEADLRLEKMRADAARAPQLPEYTGPSMTREEAKAFVADLKRRVAERIAEGKGHAA